MSVFLRWKLTPHEKATVERNKYDLDIRIWALAVLVRLAHITKLK